MSFEVAISEAVGALEAVARIRTGNDNFDRAIAKIFKDRVHAGALARSFVVLYGYASQLPGARHGRFEEPEVSFGEAQYVVRAVAVAIVFLVEEHAS
jgi:hypothetical protein